MNGDVTDPVVQNCPPDITRTITRDPSNPTPQFTNVQWEEPIATDDSGEQPTVIRSAVPGTAFPVGTAEVTYTFTDAADNSADCSFNVIGMII